MMTSNFILDIFNKKTKQYDKYIQYENQDGNNVFLHITQNFHPINIKTKDELISQGYCFNNGEK